MDKHIPCSSYIFAYGKIFLYLKTEEFKRGGK
jgi:hypothetical protein